MTKKSIREMTAIEKKRHSLSIRVFRMTIIGAAVLGAVVLVIGLSLYTYALTSQNITESFQLSSKAKTALTTSADIVPMAERTMEIYRAQTDDERKETGTPDYRARFDEIVLMPAYQTAMDTFNAFLEDSNVFDLYLAMYDENTSSIVYIANPLKDPKSIHEIKLSYSAGDWEKVGASEIKTFLGWNGEGMLYNLSNTGKNGRLCTCGVPVRNDDGEIVAFVMSEITLTNVVLAARAFFWQYFVAIVVVTIALALILSYRMKKLLVQPINTIAAAAEDYVNDKRNGNTRESYFNSLDVHTGDELENLSLVMADMEREVKDYVVNLTKATAEKERVSTEMGMATKIQEGMLPTIFPAFPNRSEFDIYATMLPAREVGGDFYDFFFIDDDHLCMVIADVSGKGIPAALFMMASKIIISNNAKKESSPAKILEETNAAICANNRMELFVTVWLGILEISTGKLTAANAGHEYPTVRHADGYFEFFKDKHGVVIGAMDGVKYREYEIMLEPGAKLFIYTDGVPEATNAESKMFGVDRMLEALNKDVEADPKTVLNNVKNAVGDFVRDAEQFDDLTMLCMEYKLRGENLKNE